MAKAHKTNHATTAVIGFPKRLLVKGVSVAQGSVWQGGLAAERVKFNVLYATKSMCCVQQSKIMMTTAEQQQKLASVLIRQDSVKTKNKWTGHKKYQILVMDLFLSSSVSLTYIHVIQYHWIFDVDICVHFSYQNNFPSSDWCDVSVKTGSHLQHVAPRSNLCTLSVC